MICPERFTIWALITLGCLLSTLLVVTLAFHFIDWRHESSDQRKCRNGGGVIGMNDKEWHCAGVPPWRPR